MIFVNILDSIGEMLVNTTLHEKQLEWLRVRNNISELGSPCKQARTLTQSRYTKRSDQKRDLFCHSGLYMVM